MGLFGPRKERVSASELAEKLAELVRPPADDEISMITKYQKLDEDAMSSLRYEWMIFIQFSVSVAVQHRYNGYIDPIVLGAILDSISSMAADKLLLTKYNIETGNNDLTIYHIHQHVRERFEQYWPILDDDSKDFNIRLMKLGQAVASHFTDSPRDPAVSMPFSVIFASILKTLGEMFDQIEISVG